MYPVITYTAYTGQSYNREVIFNHFNLITS